MRTEAEIGVMLLQAKDIKECWQLPETKRETWSSLSLRAIRRKQPYRPLDFRRLASRTGEKKGLWF